MAGRNEAADSQLRSSNLSVPPGEAAGQNPLAQSQRLLWSRLGVESCRVWAIDRGAGAPIAGRWMSEGGGSSGLTADLVVDGAGPGVLQQLQQWARPGAARLGNVVTHMLSPRRWLLFWPVAGDAGLLAQVRYQQGQTALDADSTATIQVLCEQWMGPELSALAERQLGSEGWNRVDRRARGNVPRALIAALAAMLICVGSGLWLSVGGAAAAGSELEARSREAVRVAKLADETMVRGLSHVLATGDYGELQHLLSEKATIGQLEAAVVVNPRGLTVAEIGSNPGVRLGLAVPAELQSASRVLDLSRSGQPLGRLLIVKATASPAPAGSTAVGSLRGAGLLIVAAGLAGIGLLGWHVRLRYRSWLSRRG